MSEASDNVIDLISLASAVHESPVKNQAPQDEPVSSSKKRKAQDFDKSRYLEDYNLEQ